MVKSNGKATKITAENSVVTVPGGRGAAGRFIDSKESDLERIAHVCLYVAEHLTKLRYYSDFR